MVMLGQLVKKYIIILIIQIILTLSSRNITRHKLYKVSCFATDDNNIHKIILDVSYLSELDL